MKMNALAALSIRIGLLGASLALSACIAPPAAVYSEQPPVQSYSTQPFTQQSYPAPAAQYFATFCAAGAYQCPVPQGTPVGTSCACSGIGAPSYGAAR